MNSKPRVLVVGAGPTGLTAAVELARRGVDVKLIERRTSSSGLSRAVGLQPASIALLQPSGVARKILTEAIAYRSVVVHSGDQQLASIEFPNGNSQATLYGLAQDRTELHLRCALESFGGQLHYGQTLKSIRQKQGYVIAGIQSAEGGQAKGEDFDYVIGADGVDSAVRSQLGLEFSGYELPQRWSIADVDCKDWNTSGFRIYLLTAGQVVVVAPMEVNRVRIVANSTDALALLPVPIDVVRIRRQSEFKIAVRQVARYAVGRVFLAGDAAHCHSPVGGRGMNLGIADAADLAARLSVGQVEGYHQARHAAGRKVIADSERTRRLLMSKSSAVRAVVGTAFRAVGRYEFLQRRAIDGILGR